MMDSDPAAAPLSGLLVYVSSALSTPHLVYILAQTPLPGQGGSFSCNPPQTCAQAQAGGSSTSHRVPPGCLTSCMRRAAVQTRSCTLASHLPTFKVGGWGDDAGSSISRASVKFKAERPGHGQRWAISSCIVLCPLCGPIARQTEGLARNCGGAGPSGEAKNPQMLYRSLRVGNSELTSIAGVVSEPSWLAGAELSGPPSP